MVGPVTFAFGCIIDVANNLLVDPLTELVWFKRVTHGDCFGDPSKRARNDIQNCAFCQRCQYQPSGALLDRIFLHFFPNIEHGTDLIKMAIIIL